MRSLADPPADSGSLKSTSILGAGNPGFLDNFDEKPFEFEHCFTPDHPSFQLPRLRRLLSDPRTRGGAYYDAGEIGIGQRWDSVPERKMTMEETFDHLDNAGAWILLKRVENDPEYRELLEGCLEEVKRLSGREIDQDKKKQEAIIFITSPNRVTSYHIDRECNFLMQVKGQKEISVFDRNDRQVTPEEELERFWSEDNNAGVYKPQFQDHATVFNMRPGTGVHIPVNSPHWLKNGDSISISFSISYQYKDARRKYIYQANYYLRKVGINPTPPGRSALLDNVKRLAMGAGHTGARLLRRGRD